MNILQLLRHIFVELQALYTCVLFNNPLEPFFRPFLMSLNCHRKESHDAVADASGGSEEKVNVSAGNGEPGVGQ